MPERLRSQSRLLLGLLAACLLVVGCSNGGPEADIASPDSCTVSLFTTLPQPPITSGDPPANLDVTSFDTSASGLGPAAETGDLLLVDYVLQGWHSGTTIETSEARGPLPLELGSGSVIEGWDLGLAGLRQCERARLTVPPEFGYPAGVPPEIAPNETLIFDVQITRIVSPATLVDPAAR